MNIRQLVREDIREMVPYEPHAYNDVVKMDANENPNPFPAEVMQEIYAGFKGQDFVRYPDPAGQELRAGIAAFNGTSPQNIVLGNGSDELIQLILQTFGGPGKRVVIPVPTFSMYRVHGQITGTIPVEVSRDEDFGLDLNLLVPEIKHPDTRVTFIATPNNPTGNGVPAAVIGELASQAESLVVADEAYIDFGGETVRPLLEKYPNLIILRTLSKVGLAGLRLGYLLAGEAVTAELQKIRQPYNVNAFSQLAARVMLNRWPVFAEQIAGIISERERLMSELGMLPGIRAYPSQANFILFRVPGQAAQVHQRMIDRGILVRYGLGRSHGLPECLRVTVGTRQENDQFLEKLEDSLKPEKTA